MAWEEELFEVLEELEQRAEALYGAERAVELAERSRAEYQQVTMASRLMASLERELVLDVRGVGPVRGSLERVGTGWCLVNAASADWVVRLPAVTRVRGASERSVPEVAWSPVTRLTLGSALRRLAETGTRCVVHLVDGGRHDGLLDRVGADFAEVRLGADPSAAPGEPHPLALVAFGSLAAVSSRD